MAVKGVLSKAVRLLFQLLHLLLGLLLLALGTAEFVNEPPLFDILGVTERPSLPLGAFNVTVTSDHQVFGRVMDFPVLLLFIVYFLTLVWLKFRGVLSWVMSSCMVFAILLLVTVNRGLATEVLDWRYFTERAIIIVLDVLILSFGWTSVVMVLLLIRGWFPFKTMKGDPTTKRDKTVAVLGNIVGLYSVLTLCFFIWFTRLYVSWACINNIYDVNLLCQLTNQIQCYSCFQPNASYCEYPVLAECVREPAIPPFHCLSPAYTISTSVTGFCVFNYNIGFFTFVTVFAYVGGIYFFCRTIFKAFLKCLKVVGMIVLKYVQRLCVKLTAHRTVINEDGETSLSLSKDRISLLASLPKDYSSTRKPTA